MFVPLELIQIGALMVGLYLILLGFHITDQRPGTRIYLYGGVPLFIIGWLVITWGMLL